MTMDYKMKIEIPFGAFDSELIRQEINIPNGFKAIIDGNKIILTRIESEDEKVRKVLVEMVHDTTGDELWVDYNVHKEEALAWLEKQGEQKSQRMISAEAKEAMYDKPADKVEQKCEESKTKIFDAPTPFEDKLYAFVAACEFLAIPSKIEFILEHSQEILDAAREKIGKEQSSTWSKEDDVRLQACIDTLQAESLMGKVDTVMTNWLKSLKQRIGG